MELKEEHCFQIQKPTQRNASLRGSSEFPPCPSSLQSPKLLGGCRILQTSWHIISTSLFRLEHCSPRRMIPSKVSLNVTLDCCTLARYHWKLLVCHLATAPNFIHSITKYQCKDCSRTGRFAVLVFEGFHAVGSWGQLCTNTNTIRSLKRRSFAFC